MAVEQVLDASVLAAVFFKEPGHEPSRVLLASGALFTAPGLLSVEMASIAAKKVWNGEATQTVAAQAVVAAAVIAPSRVADEDLAPRALELAALHRFSAYDATYLALAERQGLTMVTLDGRLVDRAKAAGLGAVVTLVS